MKSCIPRFGLTPMNAIPWTVSILSLVFFGSAGWRLGRSGRCSSTKGGSAYHVLGRARDGGYRRDRVNVCRRRLSCFGMRLPVVSDNFAAIASCNVSPDLEFDRLADAANGSVGQSDLHQSSVIAA